MTTPLIDPSQLSLNDSDVPLTKASPQRRPPQPRTGHWFIKGPIPGLWISRAASLGGQALKVALAVWCEAGMKRTATVQLPLKTRQRFALKPGSVRRALVKLRDAGLVTVDQLPGRRPTITIREHHENCK